MARITNSTSKGLVTVNREMNWKLESNLIQHSLVYSTYTRDNPGVQWKRERGKDGWQGIEKGKKTE